MKVDNTPYLYGGRTLDGCDCWGYVYLYYRSIGITIDSFDDYYDDCPTLDRLSLRQVLRRVKRSGFIRIPAPVQDSVLIGVRRDGFCFAVYDRGIVKRQTDDGYQEQSFQEFLDRFDRVIYYSFS